MIPKAARAFARERITVSNTVKQLTSSTYEDNSNLGSVNRKRAQAAQITVLGSGLSIYRTEDGTTPSSNEGVINYSGDIIDLNGYDAIKKFKTIRATGSDVDIEVVYYA
jgi:uncharacterized protein YlxW (UPF0749 family)